MKQTPILLSALFFVFVIGGLFLWKDSSLTGAAGASVQSIVISEANGNYYPAEIHVRMGEPVSISLDSSVTGCLRTFTIPQLRLTKQLATPRDTLDFTPTKLGRFTFACAMGMGHGILIVE